MGVSQIVSIFVPCVNSRRLVRWFNYTCVLAGNAKVYGEKEMHARRYAMLGKHSFKCKSSLCLFVYDESELAFCGILPPSLIAFKTIQL
jgi:hypothetical protein